MRFLAIVLLALVAITSVRADDPPFLVAAREREKMAKAFEAKWSFEHSVQGKEVTVPKRGLKNASVSGRIELASDGPRWWCKSDSPTWIGNNLETVPREWSYDGHQTRGALGTQFKNGPRTGEWDTNYMQFPGEQRDLDDLHRSPLAWFARGARPGSMLNPGEGEPKWEPVGGPLQKIGDRLCEEYRRENRNRPLHNILWVDPAAGHLPVRLTEGSVTIVVEYKPHSVLGWIPSGWKQTINRPPSVQISRTTVTLESFELRDAIPESRFTIPFPVGSRVYVEDGKREREHVVAADGSLVPVQPKAEPSPSQPELPSLHRSLWVVGVAVAVFVAFVVLVKWVARRSPEPRSGS